MAGKVGTSIIIPTYNGVSLLQDCVAAIKWYTQEPYELIVVDNGSDDGTTDFLRRERAVFVSLPQNSGFPAAVNLGLQVAAGDQLLLLNNDVLVAPNWLTHLRECLDREPAAGIVGPMTNFAGGRQQSEHPYTTLEQEAEWHAQQYRGQVEDVRRIVGLCMLFSRELLEKVGLFDERFSPGHFEDDDFCHRARLLGFRSLIAKDAFVFHHGSASFARMGGLQQELIRRNRALFIEKWGFDPVQADESLAEAKPEEANAG